MKFSVFISIVCVSLTVVFGATTHKADPTTEAPTTAKPTTKPAPETTTPRPGTSTPKPAPTTTLTPRQQCSNATSCDTCVKIGSVQCLWCASNNKCLLKEHVIPTSECGLADAKWAVCWVNYEALIIACSVIGGILLIGLFVCICCCCCCKKDNKAKYAREDARAERKKADMKAGQAERRAERKAKTDEIRRKYGLVKEDNPYSRFEDE